MIASYVRLFRSPGAARLVAITLLTRLTPPMLGLALMLVVVGHTGSYGVAGLTLTGHALALAVLAPVGGRLADRRPARRVLGGFLVAHAAAYGLLLAALAIRAPAALPVAAAVLLGATTPPASPVIRAAWPRTVRGDVLRTAYTVDSAVTELTFVTGPLLVAALLPVMPAQAVVAGAGAVALLGVLTLITSPTTAPAPKPPERAAARTATALECPAVGSAEPPEYPAAPAANTSDRPAARAAKPAGRPAGPVRRRGAVARLTSSLVRVAGPLAYRPTLVLLVVAACATFTYGCLRVATLASATHFGSEGSAGMLMSLLSAGTLTGALIYGARTWPGSGRLRLIVLCAADAAILSADAAAPQLPVLAALVAVTGLLSGPRDTLQAVLLSERTPPAHHTEAFAWLNTFMWSGYGLGTAVAGSLTGPGDDGTVAFAAAAVVAVLGGVLSSLLKGTPLPRRGESRPGRRA